MSENKFTPESASRTSQRVNLESLEALTKLINPLSDLDLRLSKATPDQISLLTAVNNL